MAKSVRFISEKVEEIRFDLSTTANQINEKINVFQIVQRVGREVSCCTIVTIYFAPSEFFLLISELNERILPVETCYEFNDDASDFDDDKDVCDAIAQNVRKIKERYRITPEKKRTPIWILRLVRRKQLGRFKNASKRFESCKNIEKLKNKEQE